MPGPIRRSGFAGTVEAAGRTNFGTSRPCHTWEPEKLDLRRVKELGNELA